MKHNEMLPFRTALIGAALVAMGHRGATQDNLSNMYCSTQNTGEGDGPVWNRYQSMGACSKTCRSDYAFAILQGSDCWCSNYIPAEQLSTSDCGTTCPGFPSDLCGNPGQGLFGYVALDLPPSGTAGASTQAQSTASPPPSSTQAPPMSYAPPTSSSQSYSSSSPPPPPPIAATTTSSTSSSSSSSTSGTAVVHTKVITRSGSVVTQTVTTTPVIISGGDASATAQMQRHGLSGGAIAGIVIGSLLGLAALLLAAFLLYRRRKSSDAEGQGSTRPKRTTSVLSRTGLLSRGRPQSMVENPFDSSHDPYAHGTNSTRHSMLFGGATGVVGAGITIEPSSPLDASQDNLAGSSSSRRPSKPLVYDQRLNPSALFANAEANGSRVSMQDQQDYSRPLGVMNPDYRASFDSR